MGFIEPMILIGQVVPVLWFLKAIKIQKKLWEKTEKGWVGVI